MSKKNLNPNVENIRNKITLGPAVVENISSTAYPGVYDGYDDSFSIDSFKKEFEVKIISEEPAELEFDMIGVDASIANTVRRILIAEVPTIAAETCYIYNNTSIIQDEVLSHRIGLIPIQADPRKFEYNLEGAEHRDETNHIVFRFKQRCEKRKGAPTDSTDPDLLYVNHKVLSSDMEWIPQGNQKEEFANDPPQPVNGNILVALLRPGQEIDMEIHCVKGIGKEHAKWSPVGTASYRLLPEIILKRDFVGEEADELASCFSEGVIAVEEGSDGIRKARVANARACTMSREVFRHANLAQDVVLQRDRSHFIFSVESTGCYPSAAVLVSEAIGVMMDKVQLVENVLTNQETNRLHTEDKDEETEEIEADKNSEDAAMEE